MQQEESGGLKEGKDPEEELEDDDDQSLESTGTGAGAGNGTGTGTGMECEAGQGQDQDSRLEQLKRERRLAKNRECARARRRRKKLRMDHLEDQVEELVNKNNALQKTNQDLVRRMKELEEKLRLKDEQMKHGKAPLLKQQQPLGVPLAPTSTSLLSRDLLHNFTRGGASGSVAAAPSPPTTSSLMAMARMPMPTTTSAGIAARARSPLSPSHPLSLMGDRELQALILAQHQREQQHQQLLTSPGTATPTELAPSTSAFSPAIPNHQQLGNDYLKMLQQAQGYSLYGSAAGSTAAGRELAAYAASLQQLQQRRQQQQKQQQKRHGSFH